ncbi:MAG: hypothetical protein QGD90_05325 [Candidatus Hydrogenedentes bacterium]|nr:hypothetical protein [Candidatus Hydrogenedentota bacterium]
MENIGIGAIIFIVFIVISIAQKIKERAEIARAKGQHPQSKPGEMSEEARRMPSGEEASVREAAPRGAPPARRERKAPAQELMEALFGAETVEPEEEAEWPPAAPAPRPELSPQVQRPAPPPIRREVVAQHVESRVQHEPVHEGATTRQESIRLRQAQEEQQRQREEKQGQRPRQKQIPRRKSAGVPRTPPTRRHKRERLVSGAHEVRKAIVFAEILGPPKAFRDR